MVKFQVVIGSRTEYVELVMTVEEGLPLVVVLMFLLVVIPLWLEVILMSLLVLPLVLVGLDEVLPSLLVDFDEVPVSAPTPTQYA